MRFYLNHGLKSTPFRYRLRPYEITHSPFINQHLNNMRHPQTYPVNSITVLKKIKYAPGVNSFHIDLDLGLARCLDLDLDLVDLIKTPEPVTIDP